MEPKVIKQNQQMFSKDCKYCKEDNPINNNATDLFPQYLHDIRNIQILDKEMIKNICNMSNVEKMDIIIALNDVVANLKSYLE